MGRTFLPPGFRFHPTDAELILYYLKRKIMGKKFHFEAILELNIYKFSPWDLPDKSCLKSKDREWYFFCPRERKYSSGARMNRGTETGYWKTTGRDRPITHNEQTVGMVKTLVFHEGNPPKGERTDWVIHEYRIVGLHMEDKTIQDSYVLCKVFKKNGPGPRNGAQYGAPFKEEDWEYDVEACDGPTLPGLADLINQNFLAVTNMVDQRCASGQPSTEPGPSLSRLPTNEVSLNNENCLVVTSVVDPESTAIQPLAESGPSLTWPQSSEVLLDDDDDINRFFASLENTDSLPIENIQDINCCNQGLNVEMMPCAEGNDIYSAFGDLDNFTDHCGGGFNFSGNLVTNQSPNLLFPQDDASFLELDDLVIPVDHYSTQASETQPLMQENLYSSYIPFHGAEQFNCGGNFSWDNQFISTQSQVQVPPIQSIQQATPIDFNANQGCNTSYNYGFDTSMHQYGSTHDDRDLERGRTHFSS